MGDLGIDEMGLTVSTMVLLLSYLGLRGSKAEWLPRENGEPILAFCYCSLYVHISQGLSI